MDEPPVPVPAFAQVLPQPPTDPGIEHLGGPVKAEALRQQLIQANNEAFQRANLAQKAASAKQADPAQNEVRIVPRPQAESGKSAVRPAAVNATKKAAAAEAPWAKVDLAGEQVSAMAVTANTTSYTLTQSKEFFQYGETATVTFTLTSNGQPVEGATIDLGGSRATTAADGTASIPYTARSYGYVEPVAVSPDGANWSEMSYLYTLGSDEGVLLISDITNPDGTPIQDFFVNGYHPYTHWGRSASGGILREIRPAGLHRMEVRAEGNTATYYLYHEGTVPAGGKLVLHPSTSDAVPLTVTATRSGLPLSGSVNVRNEAIPHANFDDTMPESLRVTPGTYSVIFRSDGGPETVLLSAAGVNVTTATTLPLDGDSATLQVTVDDPTGMNWLRLNGNLTGMHLSAGSPLFVQPQVPYDLEGYGKFVATDTGSWEYQFWANRPAWNSADTQPTLYLGGPLNTERYQTGGCNQPGCDIWTRVALRTLRDDYVQVFRADNNWQPAQGTLQLVDAGDATVDQKTVDIYQWDASLRLPEGAAGTYRVMLDFPNLGPVYGSFHAEYSVDVFTGTEATYAMTLSESIVAPETPVTITATVTRNGQPAAGILVQADWGEYGTATTDAAGQATFAFVTPWRGETIRFHAATPERGSLRLAELYVVPEDHGVVMIDQVTDRFGNPINSYDIQTYWFTEDGCCWSLMGTWSDAEQTGLVLREGLNYLEIFSYGEDAYFLFQPVTVESGAITHAAFDGQQTVRLDVATTLDGLEVYGGTVLHNRAMNWPSRANMTFGGTVYATPGTYNVLFRSDYEPLVLTRTGVDLTQATTLTFTEQTDGLARLAIPASVGEQSNVPLDGVDFEAPGFAFSAEPGELLVTPGLEYRARSVYAYGEGWDYNFWGNNGSWQTPLPNQTTVLNTGGPLWLKLEPQQSGPLMAGSSVYWQIELLTDSGLRAQVEQNGMSVAGTLEILDSANNLVSSRPIHTWSSGTTLTMPQTPGTYTVKAYYPDLGPYQANAGTSVTVEVSATSAAEPVQLSLQPQAVPAGMPTTVTVTATRNGQPVSGLQVDAWWLGSKTTDANGQVTLNVNEPGSIAISVDARQNGRTVAHSTLFVLNPTEAAVEIGGTDAQGAPLNNFWASAQVVVGTTTWGYSNGGPVGPLGVIVPAGDALVQLIREGGDAYFLNTRLPVSAGVVNRVMFDGAQAPINNFTALLDTAPIAGGWVSLAPQGTQGYFSVNGLNLNGSGTGTAHITPGDYLVSVKQLGAPESMLARLPNRNLTGGDHTLVVNSADLGRISVTPHLSGSPLDGKVQLFDGRFDTWVPFGTVALTAGTWYSSNMRYDLPQSATETWQYELGRSQMLKFIIASGSNSAYNMEMAVASAKVDVSPATYKAGDRLSYRLLLTTADGWEHRYTYKLPHRYTAAPLSARITDAQGNTVYTAGYVSVYSNSWTVPATPSPSYTFHMERNLGALGMFSASTKVIQGDAAPSAYKLSVDQDVIWAGRANPVRVSLTKGGKPVPNALVRFQGESTEYRMTDKRGQMLVPLKPTKAGTWNISYQPPQGSPVYTYVYALAPGYGLVDLLAMDREGFPLSWMAAQAVTPVQAQGFRSGTEVRKMLLPVGRAQVAVRGHSKNNENYALTADLWVGEGPQALLLTAQNTVALDLTVPATLPYTGALLTLRNRMLPYTEQYALPFGLQPQGRRTWVTPGSYDALITVRGTDMVRFLTLPTKEFWSDQSFTVDPLQANVDVYVNATSANGSPGTDLYVKVLSGSAGITPDVNPGSHFRVAPGTWNLDEASFAITDTALDERWVYAFSGRSTFKATAGTATTLNLGGPLTVSLANQPVFTPNGTGAVTAVAKSASGLTLNQVRGYVASTGQYLGYAPAIFTITGTDYSESFETSGSTLNWTAPGLPGTYTVQYAQYMGPYGPDATGTGTVQVVKLPNRFLQP